MSSQALSQRANWQAGANAGGANHEMSIKDIFNKYFATEEGTNYQFIPKPNLLSQLFLENDYKKNPEAYAKPADPKEGDIYYDEEKKRFFKFTGRAYTEAKLGMVPDGMILNYATGKRHLIEAKKQNDAGNAHERGCRYDTEKIRKTLQERLDTEAQPISWIFTGSMTQDKKYILEIASHLPDNHYVLLRPDQDKETVLIEWFNRVVRPILE
jgi:hypothetical protein